MDKKDIYKLRQELAKEEERVDKAKTKRAIITIICFAVVIFIIMYRAEHPTGIEILGAFLASVFLAGIYFYINSLIFIALFSKAQSENRMLENMRKEIAELEKQERNNK